MTGKQLPNTDLLPNISLTKACNEYASLHNEAVDLNGPRLASLASRLQQLAHVLPHPQWDAQLCRSSAQHCAADVKSDKGSLSSQLSGRAVAAQAAAAPSPGPAAVPLPATATATPAAAAAAVAGASDSAGGENAAGDASIVISSVTSCDAVQFTCSQEGMGQEKRLVWSVHNRHPAGRTVSVTLTWVADAAASMAPDGTLRSTRHNYFMPSAPVTLLLQPRQNKHVYTSKAVKPGKAFASTGREWQFKWSAVRRS